jgi:hypothetical protein
LSAPSPGLRDAAFVLCLSVVLSVGVVGVLLLNTSMQQQSDRLTVQRQQVAVLAITVQQLHTQLDRTADPARLAARARRLHMRPAVVPRFFSTSAVSARSRAAARGRAG